MANWWQQIDDLEDDPNLRDAIESAVALDGADKVVNDTNLYTNYIMARKEDWYLYAPEIMDSLLEAFNNDWIDYVEGFVDDEEIEEEDEEDEEE